MRDTVEASLPRLWPFGRAAVLMIIWLVLTKARLSYLPVGIIAVAFATWASVSLAPVVRSRPSPVALARLAGHMLVQSITAGFDVALRAFHPRLPLKPGFVAYKPALPVGPSRNLFGTLASLVPGTLPVGTTADGDILIHCLDEDQPVAAGMAADEARLIAALGGVRPGSETRNV
jgi:multicomponent Na+:H+ antiporter subunit E